MYFGAKNLNVYYGKKQVLRDVSLEIEQGKTTAIIGINGSGKSTLLKALGRLIKYEGEVIYKDERLSNRKNLEIAKILTLLPQAMQAPSDITVYELVSLGRFPHQKLTQQNLSEADKRFVEQVMKETEIWELRNQRVAQLSGGQRQRAFITMILAQDSEIILLDEPTTYLDLLHQLDILKLLKTFAKKMNKTVVYVIHDLNHAARFADNLVIVKEGEIFASGPVEELFTEEIIHESFGLHVRLGRDLFCQTLMITGVKNED
ncbi:ABC transporter ATP-binding protein [Lactococcus petauri]|uniref:Iron ABC transporter ATP-binding protein n=1 Tax=Lactococcus petauri TaxID=1940789 RepID=A0A252CFY2_9LACT|nr:ABC transporter ATP-binding protein [Lactococcus petauri]NHI76925.1 ABC transporter ATP-binding protein [Lactococcus petauri]OUK05461.1 iron ABC transporter ATP-binding protein [Lactococcus petauri]USI66933.1 ABC transporter ATP-binding protein [Lactococcus petauri]